MSTNPAFGTEEQVSGGGATSLASVRHHVFVCSEVCDGGALRLGPEFQNSSRSGIRSRLFFVSVAGGAVAALVSYSGRLFHQNASRRHIRVLNRK